MSSSTPTDLGDGIGLSGEVLAALGPATALALAELARLGRADTATRERLAYLDSAVAEAGAAIVELIR